MPFPANSRLQAENAPGGLDLVQELLNTGPSGPEHARRPDLLEDAAAVREWATEVLGERGLAPGRIDDVDAAALRGLRDRLVETLRDGSGADGPIEDSAPVELVLQGSGRVDLAPADSRSAVRGLVLAEVLLAQARGDWARLKLCALGPCGAAFFDHSRNSSARYHSARCANHVNLANSRARRHA